MGRNVYLVAQFGCTLQQVASNAIEVLEHLPNSRCEVVVPIAGSDDVLPCVVRAKPSTYVETLAEIIEKLKRFSARAVVVGVLPITNA